MLDEDDSRLDWATLDALVLSGQKLEFVRRVQEATSSALGEALNLLVRRYDFLRCSRSEDFACMHEEYWRGFRS